jgi:hypothetical protein
MRGEVRFDSYPRTGAEVRFDPYSLDPYSLDPDSLGGEKGRESAVRPLPVKCDSTPIRGPALKCGSTPIR